MENAPFAQTDQRPDEDMVQNAPQQAQEAPKSQPQGQPQDETPQRQQGQPTQATPLADYVPNDEPAGAAPEKDEIERLLEDPSQPLALSSGTVFTIRQLRLREMLRLLRIISRGSSAFMSELDLDFENPDEFVQTFVAMIVFSIPEAEDQTIDFLQSMVDIPNPTGHAKTDAQARLDLVEELANPDLDEAVSIITAIVAHEGRDLAALGKRLRSLMAVATKMGQVPDVAKPATAG